MSGNTCYIDDYMIRLTEVTWARGTKRARKLSSRLVIVGSVGLCFDCSGLEVTQYQNRQGQFLNCSSFSQERTNTGDSSSPVLVSSIQWRLMFSAQLVEFFVSYTKM